MHIVGLEDGDNVSLLAYLMSMTDLVFMMFIGILIRDIKMILLLFFIIISVSVFWGVITAIDHYIGRPCKLDITITKNMYISFHSILINMLTYTVGYAFESKELCYYGLIVLFASIFIFTCFAIWYYFFSVYPAYTLLKNNGNNYYTFSEDRDINGDIDDFLL